MDQTRLKERVHYNPDMGIFTWLISGPRVKAGKMAGNPDWQGYLTFKIDKRKYKAHRLAWFYVYGEWPPHQVDHINGIRNDNRIANLRLATNSENQRNARRRHDNKSGCKGVHWSAVEDNWVASIRLNGKLKTLGRFAKKEDAIKARISAAERLHGPFARHD